MNDKLKKYCKNYNIITNCEFLEDDLFSKKLVEFYKNAVNRVSDEKSLNKLSKFDNIMRKYIEDYTFSKKLRNSIDVTSLLQSNVDLTDALLEYAIDFNDKYNADVDAPVVNTRWI